MIFGDIKHLNPPIDGTPWKYITVPDGLPDNVLVLISGPLGLPDYPFDLRFPDLTFLRMVIHHRVKTGVDEYVYHCGYEAIQINVDESKVVGEWRLRGRSLGGTDLRPTLWQRIRARLTMNLTWHPR